MKKPFRNDSYLIINVIFCCIILMVLGYAFVFGSGNRNYPIPSGYQILKGESSPSAGLSRSFSAMVRLNLNEAKRFNPHGPGIFLFFIIQLFLRITFTVLILKFQTSYNSVVVTDILLSISLFTFLFWPFIKLMVE